MYSIKCISMRKRKLIHLAALQFMLAFVHILTIEQIFFKGKKSTI